MKNLMKYAAMLSVGVLVAACSETYEEPLPEKTEKEPVKEEVVVPASENSEEYVPFNVSTSEKMILRSQATLAWDMLEATMAENEGKDVIISPLCAEIALAMTANGMGDDSAKKALEVLGTDDLDLLNAFYSKVISVLPVCSPWGARTEMFFANWQDKNRTFNPEYTKTLEDVFGVQTYTYDFRSTDIKSVVNKWTSEKTGGLIPEILGEPVGRDEAMILCNSLYMNSKWATPFDKAKTKAEPFKDLNGNTTGKAMMMHHTKASILYYDQYDKYKVVEIPFKGKEFNMHIYLPMSGCTSLQELIAEMKKSDEVRLAGKCQTYLTPEMVMPKFEFGGNYEMNGVIKTLGLDLDNCDYSGISNEIKRVSMKQGSTIKVEEEGTIAASITVQTHYAGSDGQFPEMGEPFIVDHPFIYTIENKSGIMLFVGTMSNPGVK